MSTAAFPVERTTMTQADGMAAMTKIINTLMQRPDSVPFREPVDWRGLGLYDYPQVIAKPMCLDVVEYKIKFQHYITVEQCAADIRLIWDNCKRYNGEGSDFYKIADRLSKRFEELFSKVKPETKKRDRDADLTEEASKKMRASINDVVAELLCPINRELPFDPVLAEDGKIYERDAILKWFAKKAGDATSPSTGAVIGTKLLPAVQVRNTIESLIQTGAIEGEIAEAWQEASAKKRADEMLVKGIRAKAEGGDGDAMHWMGVCYTFGQGAAKDEAQARAWYERSAAARNPKGLASFSNCLLTGAGGPQDFALGLLNMTEAAYLGSDMGAAVLGESFFNGMCGLPKDPVRARFWLKKVVDGECEVKHICPTCMPNVTRMLAALDAAPAE